MAVFYDGVPFWLYIEFQMTLAIEGIILVAGGFQKYILCI